MKLEHLNQLMDAKAKEKTEAKSDAQTDAALFNNFVHLQQQKHYEYLMNEFINQQQMQLKLQLEQQIQNLIPNTADLSMLSNILLSSSMANSGHTGHASAPSSSESSCPYARVQVDYSHQSAVEQNFVCFLNKKKITIGRKLNASLVNTDNMKLADVLIENSTLVSRHHFSVELKASSKSAPTSSSSDFCYMDSEDSENSDADDQIDKSKHYYWKLLCTSKNGLFINTRYIQTGKHVQLLNKKYTFRFPNTNIKVYFESLVDTVHGCTPSPTLTTVSSEEADRAAAQAEPKKEPKSNNKIAQILMQKQMEQQRTSSEPPKREEMHMDESSNHSHSDKTEQEASCKKPPYSYAQLIAQAISSSKEQQLTLSQIYQFISSNYSYYKLDDKGWQNSIRHNLSLNRNFVKVARQQNEPGKGSFWRIESSSELKVKEQAFNRKSRSSTPNGMSRTANQSSPNYSSSSSSSINEAKEENEKSPVDQNEALMNYLKTQGSQVPYLTLQPMDQMQAILGNNLFNSNPALIQLLCQNMVQSQNNLASQNLLVIQPQVPQVAIQTDNSVKLRLLLNDETNGPNCKRTISQVLANNEISHENGNKKSCQENDADSSKLSTSTSNQNDNQES
ncbi:forkhead box K2-like [Brachionus plicatilis]|uniref:Forkhead box K2-like n=1 Tax=Brachionus plicatilis TaxID=10195 RepID=A0A3M7SPM1_BRAPC|nr:forkhead box K2-like [Brachionus plicatilis]